MNRNTFKISYIGYKKKVYLTEAQEMKLRLPGPPPRNQLTRGLGPDRRAWWFRTSSPPGRFCFSLPLSLSLWLPLSLSSFPSLTKHREEEDVHLCECPLNVQALVVLNSRLACKKKKSDYPTGLYLPQVSISCLVIDGFGSGGHKTNPVDGGSFQQKGAWAGMPQSCYTPGIEV